MTTIVFVHGLGNKPESTELLRLWQRSLSRDDGIDLNAESISSEMVYWADVFYAMPDPDLASYEALDEYKLTAEESEAVQSAEIQINKTISIDERNFIEQLAKKYEVPVRYVAADAPRANSAKDEVAVYERIPLPGFLKELIMAAFVKEAYAYIFNKESNPTGQKKYQVRSELRNRFVTTLKQIKSSKPDEPIVVVSHSMGTMIAYDCLKSVLDCPVIDAFFTIGSPLGIDEIQDGFIPDWTRNNGFPSKKLSKKWFNFYDPRDVVACLDSKLANDFQNANVEVIEDIEESNWGAWRHSISKYLQGKVLRSKLKISLNI
jgi:hypothetical protein